MRREPTRRRVLITGASRNAFTLNELVATVALLAVWSVWLIPTAAGVRQSSKQGRCLANLSRIGYANSIYAAQDPADMAIPVNWRQFCQCPGEDCGSPCMEPLHIGAYEWGGKSGRGQPGDPYAIERGAPVEGEFAWLSSKFGTPAGAGPARRPLNGILYRERFADHTEDQTGWEADTALELDVYRCPSDSGYTGIHSPAFRDDRLTSYDHFGTSYGANMFMVANSGGGWMSSNSPYLHRMSELPSPATTLAFQENNGRFAWTAAPEQPECVATIGLEGIVGTVRGWHGKDWTFNAAFIDGHAKPIYMRGYENPTVYQPGDPTGGSYRCIIIRGESWQIDTLPLEPVYTPLWHGGVGRPSYEGEIE